MERWKQQKSKILKNLQKAKSTELAEHVTRLFSFGAQRRYTNKILFHSKHPGEKRTHKTDTKRKKTKMSKSSKTCLREKGAFYKALEKAAQQQIDDFCCPPFDPYDWWNEDDEYDYERAYAQDVEDGLYDEMYYGYEDDWEDINVDEWNQCVPGKYYTHINTGVTFLCCYVDCEYHFVNLWTGRAEPVYMYQLREL